MLTAVMNRDEDAGVVGKAGVAGRVVAWKGEEGAVVVGMGE
jgi:hypothetical protein